jgi:hypothetical protein
MKIKLIFFFIITLSIKLPAQNFDPEYTTVEDSSGNVLNFINSFRVDDLLNKKKRSSAKKIRAYRIQLFSGLRSGSNQTKIMFKRLYPKIIVENSYEQPYFKTKVGAFRTRISAEKKLIEFKKHFKSAFIFEEDISIDKL